MDATNQDRAPPSPTPARPTAPGEQPGRAWHAELDLAFARRGPATVLVRDRHAGPLLVQKTLHPEGESLCHAIVLHPPAGIAAGDQLTLHAAVEERAQVLLTTPGATKWYRSTSAVAGSAARLSVAAGATLEYLPREAIVFDGARASALLEVELGADAILIGWDLWCLGRTASGEVFRHGRLQLASRVRRDGRLCWEERCDLDAGSALLHSPAGLAGQPVFGTLFAAGPEAPRSLVDACRALPFGQRGQGALTQLPGVLLARYLGPSTEEAFAWFTALWTLLRPLYVGREAVRPRIWAV